MADDLVQVAVVSSEQEAAVVVGFLESRGIRAAYDKGGTSSPLGAYMGPYEGVQQILVRAEEEGAARAALDERNQGV
jgi:hypothetical protein